MFARVAVLDGIRQLGEANVAAAVLPAAIAPGRPLLERMTAAEIAGALAGKTRSPLFAPLLPVLRAGVNDTDPLFAAACAGALGDWGDSASVPLLARAWAIRARESEPDARNAVRDALRALAGAAFADSRSRRSTSPRVDEPRYAKDFEVAPKQRGAVIHTTAGDIEWAFDAADAPQTVRNFVTLARRGYFDGKLVHRVVPDFVIQDGDPTGTGSGGPGWTIRCEYNRLRYEAGMVGMALSGKDTGGSQWFVTLSPQPHLNGRYTIFAHVVRGLDVRAASCKARASPVRDLADARRVRAGFARGALSAAAIAGGAGDRATEPHAPVDSIPALHFNPGAPSPLSGRRACDDAPRTVLGGRTGRTASMAPGLLPHFCFATTSGASFWYVALFTTFLLSNCAFEAHGRPAMILPAIASPTPGSLISSSLLALFRSTSGAAGLAGVAAVATAAGFAAAAGLAGVAAACASDAPAIIAAHASANSGLRFMPGILPRGRTDRAEARSRSAPHRRRTGRPDARAGDRDSGDRGPRRHAKAAARRRAHRRGGSSSEGGGFAVRRR